MAVSVHFRPQLFYPGLRFGNQPLSGQGIDDMRQVLSTFIEKGKPLVLPTESEIPTSVKPTFDQGLQQLTPQQMDTLKNKGSFGVAEEASDILYYLGIKAMMHSGAFTPQRAVAFETNITNLLYAGTPQAFDKIHDLAKQTITPQDVQVMKPYFPLSASQSDNLLRDYLVMALVDNALWSSVAGTRGQLYRLDRADAKITEETLELGEHLQRLQGHDASSLIPHLNQLQSATDFQNCFKTLQNLGYQALSTPDFTLDNLLKFAIMKSSGRTEAQFLKRNTPYNELKAEAKAWEKILEAQVFLQHV